MVSVKSVRLFVYIALVIALLVTVLWFAGRTLWKAWDERKPDVVRQPVSVATAGCPDQTSIVRVLAPDGRPVPNARVRVDLYAARAKLSSYSIPASWCLPAAVAAPAPASAAGATTPETRPESSRTTAGTKGDTGQQQSAQPEQNQPRPETPAGRSTPAESGAAVSGNAEAERVFILRDDLLATFPAATAAVISAEAPSYFAEHSDEVIIPAGENRRARLGRNTIYIHLRPYNPYLIMLVLAPALLGMVGVVLYLTQRSYFTPSVYPIGAALVWSLVVFWLAVRYAAWDEFHIPLFWSDVFVSSGVIVFSFLGSLVYTAYVLEKHTRSLFDRFTPVRKRKFFFRLGGQVLVAPYVATVAHLILTSTFEALREGPFAVFLGFFAGLSIKPILGFLNEVGMRVISAENGQVVAQRMLRRDSDAPPAPVADARALKVPVAFLDAAAEAREEFLKLPDVLSVETGLMNGVSTNAETLVVFIRDQRTGLPADQQVPPTFGGFPVTVAPLPAARPGEPCRNELMNLSWRKLNELHRAGNPAAPAIQTVGRVRVLTGTGSFFEIKSGHQELNPIAAFNAVRTPLGDAFDFVAFIIDATSLGFGVGNYSIPVFNSVTGINHYKGADFNQRADYSSSRLTAIQVLTARDIDPPLTFRACLHELAHTWCAYAVFKPAPGSAPRTDLLRAAGKQMPQDGRPVDIQDFYHWGPQFDNGCSCMDYDEQVYVSEGGGVFHQEGLADHKNGYSALDLYLMGLLPHTDERLRSLQLMERTASGKFRVSAKVSIDDVRRACDDRLPDNVGKTFRQAFVVITQSEPSGRVLAEKINRFLPLYEKRFNEAVEKRASLDTNA
jgi:hypothetical protein